MNFPFDEYCQRIGVAASGALNEQRLEEIHRGQMYSIPFENFDILLGRGIDFSTAKLVDKLVRSTRGGYCFELNGLLITALQAAGFEVRSLLGRVLLNGDPSGRGHHFGLVTLNGRQWLVDVGFGGPGLRAPMPFECNVECEHDGLILKLVEDELGYILQFRQSDGTWRNAYSFDLMPVVHNDLVMGNHFTSTFPHLFFTKDRLAIRSMPNGNYRLRNLEVTKAVDGVEEKLELPDGPEYLEQIKILFGIELDASYDQLRPVAQG